MVSFPEEFFSTLASFSFFLSSSHIAVFFLPNNLDQEATQNLAIFSVDEKISVYSNKNFKNMNGHYFKILSSTEPDLQIKYKLYLCLNTIK